MQTILSEKQIELLQLNHIDFQQFVETSKKQYPFVKRSLKHYKMHPKIAWDADKSILTLAWLNLQQSQHHELANQITHALNFEYYKLVFMHPISHRYMTILDVKSEFIKENLEKWQKQYEYEQIPFRLYFKNEFSEIFAYDELQERFIEYQKALKEKDELGIELY